MVEVRYSPIMPIDANPIGVIGGYGLQCWDDL